MEKRRHKAGQDPAKRDQILDGAMRVFMERGFDAASMNDICRAAGVSKGTVYVYFAGKEDLFEALIEQERDRLFLGIEAILEAEGPTAEKLARYGRRIAEIICSDQVIRAQRIIIATTERMPELGARFYDSGAERAHGAVRRFLEREVTAGRMRVPDVALAAHQFAELCTAGLWRKRLFGKARTVPRPAEIDACVDGAVAMFLNSYGFSAAKAAS